MNESIIEELIAENVELRKKLSSLNKTSIESLTTFYITEELANKIKISGVLIAEGVWNGVKYTWEELKKMYNKFKDKLSNLPIKVEHEKTKEYKDKTVGKHIKTELNETLKAILYEAEITDPKAIKDIKEGKFRATSLKSEMIKVSENGEELGRDINPIDNSLSQYPACSTCQMFNIEELHNEIKYFGIYETEDLNNIKDKDKKEVSNMDEDIELLEEDEDYIEIEEDEALVIPEEEEELEEEEEELELKIMPYEEARKKKRKIIRRGPGKVKRKIKRKKGYYYYYYPEYPIPYYYWYYYPPYYGYYPYYYGYGFDVDLTVEDELAEYKIVYNKKTKKYIVFKATGKEGFGAWKIVKQFDSKKEAEENI